MAARELRPDSTRRALLQGGALAVAAVIAGCADGAERGGTRVAMPDTEFSPVELQVYIGIEVVWENTGETEHTVVSTSSGDEADSGSFDERVSPGVSLLVSHTFETTGAYEYYCDVHGESSMCGVVLGGDVTYDGSLPCDDGFDGPPTDRCSRSIGRGIFCPVAAIFACMRTYLVGTDGTATSEALTAYLEDIVEESDRLEVVNALARGDPGAAHEGEAGLAVFEERFGDRPVVLSTRQVNRDGETPAETLTALGREFDAHQIVVGLRQHSRTERIIFGSVSQSVVKQTDRAVTLVPIPEYTVSE